MAAICSVASSSAASSLASSSLSEGSTSSDSVRRRLGCAALPLRVAGAGGVSASFASAEEVKPSRRTMSSSSGKFMLEGSVPNSALVGAMPPSALVGELLTICITVRTWNAQLQSAGDGCGWVGCGWGWGGVGAGGGGGGGSAEPQHSTAALDRSGRNTTAACKQHWTGGVAARAAMHAGTTTLDRWGSSRSCSVETGTTAQQHWTGGAAGAAARAFCTHSNSGQAISSARI